MTLPLRATRAVVVPQAKAPALRARSSVTPYAVRCTEAMVMSNSVRVSRIGSSDYYTLLGTHLLPSNA